MLQDDNRQLHRREADKVRFESCPKYINHELTSDQITQITRIVVKQIRDEDNIRFAELIKTEGKSLFFKLIAALGIISIWVVGWFQSHGVKLF